MRTRYPGVYKAKQEVRSAGSQVKIVLTDAERALQFNPMKCARCAHQKVSMGADPCRTCLDPRTVEVHGLNSKFEPTE